MATDREHRALASGESILVGDVEFRLRPVVIKRLGDLEKDAFNYYKRLYLETFRDNSDLLVGMNKSDVMLKKMEEVARWDMSKLPRKIAYDVLNVPVTDKLKEWIQEEFHECPEEDIGCLAVLSSSLDIEKIGPKQVKKLTGKYPVQGTVRYDQWWVTATLAGMISFIHCSLAEDHSNTTKADIGEWSFVKVIEAAKIVERLTVAMMGNG